MKRIIGGIILAVVFAFLVGVTCVAYGWRAGLVAWVGGSAIAFLLFFALLLITGVL